jgi:hypothetical protein
VRQGFSRLCENVLFSHTGGMPSLHVFERERLT